MKLLDLNAKACTIVCTFCVLIVVYHPIHMTPGLILYNTYYRVKVNV